MIHVINTYFSTPQLKSKYINIFKNEDCKENMFNSVYFFGFEKVTDNNNIIKFIPDEQLLSHINTYLTTTIKTTMTGENIDSIISNTQIILDSINNKKINNLSNFYNNLFDINMDDKYQIKIDINNELYSIELNYVMIKTRIDKKDLKIPVQSVASLSASSSSSSSLQSQLEITNTYIKDLFKEIYLIKAQP